MRSPLLDDVLIDLLFFSIFLIPSLAFSFFHTMLLLVAAACLAAPAVVGFAIFSLGLVEEKVARSLAGTVGAVFAAYLTLIGLIRTFGWCRAGTRRSGLATFDVCASASTDSIVWLALPLVALSSVRCVLSLQRAYRNVGLIRGALLAWFLVVLDVTAWRDLIFVIAAAGWVGLSVLYQPLSTFGDATALLAASAVQTEPGLRPSFFEEDTFARSVLFFSVVFITLIVTLNSKPAFIPRWKPLRTATGALLVASIPLLTSIAAELRWDLRADSERDRVLNALAVAGGAALFTLKLTPEKENSFMGFYRISTFIAATSLLQGALAIFLLVSEPFVWTEVVRASVLIAGGLIVLL